MSPADRQSYRRRKIGVALRQFREARGWTQDAAARRLDRSQASLSAYENGHRAIRPRDLEQILDRYGVRDVQQRQQLMDLAAQGRRDGWWHSFEERQDPTVVDFASLEADASRIRSLELHLVPGLLQTESYARVLLGSYDGVLDEPHDVESSLQFRLNRQRVLRGDDPPRVEWVIGEAALHLRVGGLEVMREQIGALREASQLPHVDLRVLPFTAGSHPGVDGPFSIIDVVPDELMQVVAVHSLSRSWYIDDPSNVGTYVRVFKKLQSLALSRSDSCERLDQIASEK
ncbi:helix-turn-helix domain-containing protein [Actinomadura oligospora]|uniref:helix-turn-helix domain-containing protein n=1 Tax=Actinomadura oligospora TaxID=111804 RepID=UPI00054CFD14|nr:helix-turn-helix transcriptional regulator [Actinomadura oligospora]